MPLNMAMLGVLARMEQLIFIVSLTRLTVSMEKAPGCVCEGVFMTNAEAPGWGPGAGHRHSWLVASWLRTQCGQLPHTHVTTPSQHLSTIPSEAWTETTSPEVYWAFYHRNQKSNRIVFWDRVSSCSLGWFGTYYVVQAGSEHMADFLHQSCECWCCRCEPSCMTLAQFSAHRTPPRSINPHYHSLITVVFCEIFYLFLTYHILH